MNKVILIGRVVREPEVRYSQGANPMAVAKYTLAVDRRFKKDNEPTADFISCVAFGKNGEFAEKYLSKGTKIAVEGKNTDRKLYQAVHILQRLAGHLVGYQHIDLSLKTQVVFRG